MPDNQDRVLPPWTDELKRRYLRGQAPQLVLHGNVTDIVLSGGRFIRMSDFLSEVLLAPSKDIVLQYNVATGERVPPLKKEVPGRHAMRLLRDADKILPAVEELLHGVDKIAVIIDYAEMIAPAGDP